MKYGISGSGLAAASILFALAFVSCRMERFQEELVPGDGAAKVEVLFSTGQPETRTSFTDKTGDEYPVIWTENDEAISVSMNYDEASLAPVTPSKDGKSASFKAIFPYSSGNCRFLAVSPSSASGGPSPSRLAWTVDIPEEQTPGEKSCDEAAQVLAAVSQEFPSTPDNVNLHFKHAVAYIRLNLTNVESALSNAGFGGAAVSSIDLSFSIPVAGSWYYYLQDSGSRSACDMVAREASSTITLNTSSVSDRWLALAPVTLTGADLRITVNTGSGSIERTVNLSDEKVLTPGEVYTLNINMASAAAVQYDEVYTLVESLSGLAAGDEVIIVSAPSGEYAMSTTHNSGSNIGSTAVSVADKTVTNPSSLVERFTVGTSGSRYTFKAGGKYLVAEASTSMYGSTNYYVTAGSSATQWTVRISSGNAQISYTSGNSTYDIRYYSGFRMSTTSSYSPYTVAIFKKGASPFENIADDPVLGYETYGAYLPSGNDLYSAGTDQLSVEYDSGGNANFIILSPQGDTPAVKVFSGIPAGATKGDTFVLKYEKVSGIDLVASGEYRVAVARESGATLWLTTGTGEAFIVKK